MDMTQASGMPMLFTNSIDHIKIRDPFIVARNEERLYYLFGTTDPDPWKGKATGFDVRISKNLEEWSDAYPVFRPSEDFWADTNFWAPEIHFHRNEWYLIASFFKTGRHRGVHILKSSEITGPFIPVADQPITPKNWDCLDGTLYLENNIPWLVFSHEWTQIQIGTICAVQLNETLTKAAGDPIVLFKATDAPWSVDSTGDSLISNNSYVTDGPFIYKTSDKKLQMLWSSFSKHGYSIGVAESETNSIIGPWKQRQNPEVANGGHGMLFKDFHGHIYLAIHSPNTKGDERLKLIRWNKDSAILKHSEK